MTSINSILTNLAAFMVAIGVLVTVHEYGHFIVGKLFNVKVLKFSIGFGRSIYSYQSKKGDKTEFRLSLIPLGGYVQFLDGRNGEIKPEEDGRAFNQQSLLIKIAILFAGPMFNFIFAILAYFIVFSNGIPTMKPIVGEVVENSYAYSADIKYGDEIISIDDKKIEDWETAVTSLLKALVDKKDFNLGVKRDDSYEKLLKFSITGETAYLTEPGNLFAGLGFYPWQPPPVISEIVNDSPADKSNLMKGDHIVSVNGINTRSIQDIINIIHERPSQKISVEYTRNEMLISEDIILDQDNQNRNKGFLGVAFLRDYENYWYINRLDFSDSLNKSISQTWSTAGFTVTMLFKMISGDVSTKNISGPFSIAKYAGISVNAGFNQFLKFLALISISLGVINLFPIPMLDGGQIIQFSFESLKGSPLSPRFEQLSQQFGIMAIMLLMSIAFYNDLFS